MSNLRRALILGDYSNPIWHPLHPVDEELVSILGDTMTVECTEDYDSLLIEHVGDYNLIISYADKAKTAITPEQTAGLLTFVCNGGGLVVIHNGISLQQRPEICHMIGAKFTGHPPYRSIDIRISAPEHDILRGVEPFTIQDEPYQFDYIPFMDKTVLLEYEHEGATITAAWAHEYGLGRVVYLMPGHDIGPFRLPAYRTIIKQSCDWALQIRN
jgi:type 1 glutamine amidotransferase